MGSKCDHEFAKLVNRMHPPRVTVDNVSYRNVTLIKVDSANKRGSLLEVVQVLTDLNIQINELTFLQMENGLWTYGNKLSEDKVADQIQQDELRQQKEEEMDNYCSQVHDARNMVPMDQPKATLEMLRRWTRFEHSDQIVSIYNDQSIAEAVQVLWSNKVCAIAVLDRETQKLIGCCRSCESTVPGNGLSVRWFLGYTCCDACGRLFVKGNYCPVCLKVYRDSESTPMVCCDICQRWVHCHCDGISDEKYLQFQVDDNLQYRW